MPLENIFYLGAALILVMVSGFFSGSEAAYFSLTASQRHGLAKSKVATDRLAFSLVSQSERLLMTILFWNLVINVTYFSMVSKFTLSLDQHDSDSSSHIALITFGALLFVILFGEFFPKSIGLMYPLRLVRLAAIPLAIAVRTIAWLLPVMEFITEFSRRLVWPGMQPEPYLSAADLTRVVELSASEDELVEAESQVLQNIIQLNEVRVEEWMRPRAEFSAHTSHLTWQQLTPQSASGGYLLITKDHGQIMGYIDLRQVPPRDFSNLAAQQKAVVVVPWCATIADALQRLCDTNRRVAAVVNEYGESVGVLTWEDIFDAILQLQRGRSHRELARAEIRKLADDRWLATGLTKVRRLERAMGQPIPDTDNLTVGGIVQQHLRRLPEVGDVCQVGALRLEVIEAGMRGELLIAINVVADQETPP
ncbi:MAG: DUF21 domain-containing protein [Pirellulaceae bacterium]|nr:DUF21 domain-containing protein [Pirellulaceae bacterium]